MSRNLALLLVLLSVGTSLPRAFGEEAGDPLFVAPENQTDEDLTPLVVRQKKAAAAAKLAAETGAAPVAPKVDATPAASSAPRATVISEPAPAEPEVQTAAPVEIKPVAPVVTAAPAPRVEENKPQPEAKPVQTVVFEEKKSEPAKPAAAVVAREKKPEPVVVAKPVEPAVVAKPVEPVVVQEKKPEPVPDVVQEKKPEPAPVVVQEKKPEPAPVVAPAVATDDKKTTEPKAGDTAAKPENEIVSVTLSAADMAQLPENEKKLLEMIQQSYTGKDGAARQYFKTRKPQMIFSGQAIVKGLERNLTIQRQEKQEDIANAAKMEARAVFDPIFTVSFTHSLFAQKNRMEKVGKFRRPAVQDLRGRLQDPNFIPQPTDAQGITDLADTSVPKIPIKELVFDRIIPPGDKRLVGRTRAIASDENPNGPSQTEAPSIRIDQQLPWGPTVFISGASRRNESFFDDGPDAVTSIQLQQAIATVGERTTAANPNVSPEELRALIREAQRNDPLVTQLQTSFNQSSRKGNNTSRPWSSSFVAGVATPIPMTKDWGRYSRADLSITLADFDKERAYWDTKTVVNLTLRDIDFAYWDLVGTVEQLRAVTENRKLLDGLGGEMKKLLDAGRTTAYGLIQIDTQLASVKEQEEIAWANFAQASNFLNVLLDADKDTLFMPAGYTKALTEQIKWKPEDALAIAMENRPELKAQKIGGKTSALLVKFQENQVKPDIKYGFNFTVSQNNKPFGFKTWQQSLAGMFGNGKQGEHLVNVPVKGVATPSNLSQIKQVFKKDDNVGPDNRTHSHTIAYNWPMGNRAVKAALRESQLSHDQQEIAIDLTQNSIEQDIGNSVVNLLSFKEQFDIALDNYRLASVQYDDASKFLAAGRMTEFELVTRSRDLLFSDLARITASINYKKAETQLLQSEGILASAFASLRTFGEFDQQRLDTLRDRKALRFFTPAAIETTTVEGEAKPEAVKEGQPAAHGSASNAATAEAPQSNTTTPGGK